MSKLNTPSGLKSAADKAASVFTPKSKIRQETVAPKPKVARIVIIKKINLPGANNYAQIVSTKVKVTDLPPGETSFDLVVVLSPNGTQPPQYPPFQKHFTLQSGTGQNSTLEGGALSFSGGLEPPTGLNEYHLNLVQDVNSGEVWDIEDAEVAVLEIPAEDGMETGAGAFKVIDSDPPKPKPKVANITIVKQINLPGDDVEDGYSCEARIDPQDLPPSVTSFNLAVILTANGSEPAQSSPTSASFSLNDGKLIGTLHFSSQPSTSNNGYTVDSVTDNSNQEAWAILSSSVPVIEEP